MEKYIVDFTGCKNLDEIHAQFKRVFDFPDYYGENWSAFWDCMREMVGDPMYVEIHGFADFEKLSAWNANIFKESMEDLVNFAGGKYSHITIVKYVDGACR